MTEPKKKSCKTCSHFGNEGGWYYCDFCEDKSRYQETNEHLIERLRVEKEAAVKQKEQDIFKDVMEILDNVKAGRYEDDEEYHVGWTDACGKIEDAILLLKAEIQKAEDKAKEGRCIYLMQHVFE